MSPLYLQIERDIAETNNRYRRQRNMYFWYEYMDPYYGPNTYSDEVDDDRTLDLAFHFITRKIQNEVQSH